MTPVVGVCIQYLGQCLHQWLVVLHAASRVNQYHVNTLLTSYICTCDRNDTIMDNCKWSDIHTYMCVCGVCVCAHTYVAE